VFDPDAHLLLGKTPEEIKIIQDEGHIKAMKDIVNALVGKSFELRVARGKSGLIASEFEESL